MPVTKEQVLVTAELSRLDLAATAAQMSEAPDALVGRFAAQLDSIVGYMDILNTVDTTGVEPLYFPMQHATKPRPDVAHQRLSVDEVLANAPKKHQTFFAVPPVL